MSRNTSLSMPLWHDEGVRWIASLAATLRAWLGAGAEAPVAPHQDRRIEGEFADPRLRAELEEARRHLKLHNAGLWLW